MNRPIPLFGIYANFSRIVILYQLVLCCMYKLATRYQVKSFQVIFFITDKEQLLNSLITVFVLSTTEW